MLRPRPWRWGDPFRAWLTAIVVGGAIVRLVYTLAIAPATTGIYDAYFFGATGKLLASGHGYIRPYEYVFGGGYSVPTALHPPLYPLVLALLDWIGVTADAAQRSLGVLFGAILVAAVGLVGRRIAGDRVGLLAAAIAALYPTLITADGALMSESLYGAMIAFALLAAYALLERPGALRAFALGAAIGLAALTRSEAIFLIPLLVLPLALLLPRGRRLRAGVVACAATALVMSPWITRNAIVFHRPLVSTDDGILIAQANCPPSYHGSNIGYVTPTCLAPAPRQKPGVRPPKPKRDQEAIDQAAFRRQGLRYARAHASRLPVVMVARVLRSWSFLQPRRGVRDSEGRSFVVGNIGLGVYYVLLALAVPGIWLLRRRGPLRILLALPVLVTFTAAIGYGALRFREAAEPAVVLLAALTLDSLIAARWPRPGSTRAAPGRSDYRPDGARERVATAVEGNEPSASSSA